MDNKATVFVIGHRNPDTDSICSAIAYSRLKQQVDSEKDYKPCRAGKISDETRFVLDYFKVPEPELVEDVRTQVCDIDIKKTKGISRSMSLKNAWEMMRTLSEVTLPITNRGRLEGIITVSDITASFMEGSDSEVLSKAHTKIKNIIETLDGTLIVGDEKAYYTRGKVLIAAMNPDMMENYIKENDLVILGNRYESQLCAIEMNAACIVVCNGSPVSMTIKKLAEEKGCMIISTPYDTFTVARFINQSMPVSFYMKRDDLVTFDENDYVDDIRDTMAKLRHRDFPIIDQDGHYVGLISRRILLTARRKQVIMVDHNEPGQAVRGIQDADILEILDHHRLGTVETIAPVYFRCQPLGCTATIIWQMYNEAGIEISKQTAGLLVSAIISDTLLFRSPTCTPLDRQAGEALAKIAEIDLEGYAVQMFTAASNFANKTAEQIFYTDYKTFSIEGKQVGVAQVSSMNEAELKDLTERLQPYLSTVTAAQGLDMVFLMLTSILKEETILLYDGENAKETVEMAFGVKADGLAVLPGVVSRKKQMIPSLTNGLLRMAQS